MLKRKIKKNIKKKMMVKVNFWIPLVMRKRLLELAKRQGRFLSELLREGLSWVLKKYQE